jgi:ACS family allantoate permease-like MFS transporter
MQLPNNYMMQKFAISKYVGIILVIWGVCLFSMAFTNSFAQMAALRFLLGFFEAITYPCMFLLIATMYRRSEQVIGFGVCS